MGGNGTGARGARTAAAGLTDLGALCIIQGCLTSRQGANLCAPHQSYTTELGMRRAMEQVTQQQLDEVQARQEDKARQVLLLTALANRVLEQRDRLKAELGLAPGSRLKPTLADGSPAGAVSRTVAGIKAQVGNPEAFAAWVQKRYPSEVYLPPIAVREAFIKRVLECSEAAGVPLGPGGETAEDAPAGVRILNTPGVVRVAPDKDNAAALWAEMRSGATILEELER